MPGGDLDAAFDGKLGLLSLSGGDLEGCLSDRLPALDTLPSQDDEITAARIRGRDEEPVEPIDGIDSRTACDEMPIGDLSDEIARRALKARGADGGHIDAECDL